MSVHFHVPPTPRELDDGVFEIRWRQTAVFVSFFAIPVVFLVVGHFVPERFEEHLFVGLVLIHVCFNIYAMQSNCPRCRDTFFRRGIYSNLFTQHCLHCDLSLAHPTP